MWEPKDENENWRHDVNLDQTRLIGQLFVQASAESLTHATIGGFARHVPIPRRH
jgi:hypothetical protein